MASALEGSNVSCSHPAVQTFLKGPLDHMLHELELEAAFFDVLYSLGLVGCNGLMRRAPCARQSLKCSLLLDLSIEFPLSPSLFPLTHD